jgi:catechol 2,3-dioxygenase-like lactoylglutathione lyase family enzyme
MDVLACRPLIRPTDLERSHRFYRDQLGLAVFREFGPADSRGLVFYAGNGPADHPLRADTR